MRVLTRLFWTALVSLAVFVLSVIPVPEVPMLDGFHLFDKWVHFVMYGGLALAGWYDAFRGAGRGWRLGVVWPLVLGALMEVVQGTLTTTRSGDWADWVADAVGVIIALPIAWGMVRPLARVLSWPRQRMER